jgi:hypothetical protein
LVEVAWPVIDESASGAKSQNLVSPIAVMTQPLVHHA